MLLRNATVVSSDSIPISANWFNRTLFLCCVICVFFLSPLRTLANAYTPSFLPHCTIPILACRKPLGCWPQTAFPSGSRKTMESLASVQATLVLLKFRWHDQELRKTASCSAIDTRVDGFLSGHSITYWPRLRLYTFGDYQSEALTVCVSLLVPGFDFIISKLLVKKYKHLFPPKSLWCPFSLRWNQQIGFSVVFSLFRSYKKISVSNCTAWQLFFKFWFGLFQWIFR